MPASSKKSESKKSSFQFEKELIKLEKLIEKMEGGELSLSQSLKDFEEGVVIIQKCQQFLTEAEQKIKILTQQRKLKDFPKEEQ